MNKILKQAAASLTLAFALMLALSLSATAKGEQAMAELRDSQGEVVGTATFVQEETAVHVTIELRNLSPGFHGAHIHAVGQCEPPDFTSAGPHFNPLSKKHGLENPDGPHAGDLPNARVGTDGTGTLEATTDRVTLMPGPLSLFDDDGSALVIHASLDDQKTDPSGNSGARIACGVIQPAPATSTSTTSTPTPEKPAARMPLYIVPVILLILLVLVALGVLK